MEMTVDRLREVAAAWGRADIETLMTFVAPDCIYSASVGPEPGETFVGKEAVRAGFLKLLTHDRDSVSEPGEIRFVGDWAVMTWGFRRAAAAGGQLIRGCDLFEFRDGLIVRKDSYRKTTP
jgi:ketosteroid isomerase-like protein